MKFISEEILIDEGGFSKSVSYKNIHKEIIEAVKATKWPPGSDKFTINPGQKGERHPNGVLPIKFEFVEYLFNVGWLLEQKLNIAVRIKPGPIDLVKSVGHKYFAVEWETGNISSSHRALNKMAIGIGEGVLAGGTLVLPSRNLYNFLTDRIGNYEELLPYFPMYRLMKPENGILTVLVVEHDELSYDVPKIPKGTDGYGLGTEDPSGFRSIKERRKKYKKNNQDKLF
jgi:hypothetical protein